MIERLQKYMARCEVASRRKCEEIILAGRVRVNSEFIKELGSKIDSEKDAVYVDSKLIKPQENKIYIALNKPIGYISSLMDEKGRRTIMELVEINERIYPIGRLDFDTSGLLLLTNDGEIYNHLIHPRSSIDKVYEAIIEGRPDFEEIERFTSGIDIDGYITSKAKMRILKYEGANTIVEITIHEGKNRQVRKMCEKINHKVLALRRIRVANISVDGIESGKWRFLTSTEIEYIKDL